MLTTFQKVHLLIALLKHFVATFLLSVERSHAQLNRSVVCCAHLLIMLEVPLILLVEHWCLSPKERSTLCTEESQEEKEAKQKFEGQEYEVDPVHALFVGKLKETIVSCIAKANLHQNENCAKQSGLQQKVHQFGEALFYVAGVALADSAHLNKAIKNVQKQTNYDSGCILSPPAYHQLVDIANQDNKPIETVVIAVVVQEHLKVQIAIAGNVEHADVFVGEVDGVRIEFMVSYQF